MSLRLAGAYFDWRPIGQHAAECRRPAWEIQTMRRDQFNGSYQAGMRAVCWSCGSVHELTAVIGPEQPEDGGRLAEVSERSMATWVIGYGQSAVKAAGLWLHPGPALLGRPGNPACGYLVTTTPATPRTPADVLGVIAQARGKRGSLVWTAALGYDPATATVQGLPSRMAAARWIATTATALPVDNERKASQ
ncbi:hypothetical protein AB0395_43930 [Streptosporangium sp. NPDC051023]|uniref:hypothetical protein n=1 Tax=Streptosporangium sp. NPDC051023 TaxID=3155410 RepID=UPI003450E243